MFAEATPEPAALGTWVICFGVVLGIGLQILTFFSARKTQQRDVKILGDVASKADFESLVLANEKAHREIFTKISAVELDAGRTVESKVDKLRLEIKSDHIQMTIAADARAVGIHQRLDKFIEVVGRHEGKLD